MSLHNFLSFHLRSHIKNSCFVFHQGFQTPRNNKSTRPMASCFHYFLGVWNPWWNTRTRFWYITSSIVSHILALIHWMVTSFSFSFSYGGRWKWRMIITANFQFKRLERSFNGIRTGSNIYFLHTSRHFTPQGKYELNKIDLAANVWLHSSVGTRASHRYRGGHRFEFHRSSDFFQVSFHLLNWKILLRWSFFTFIYHGSSHMNFFIYHSHHQKGY